MRKFERFAASGVLLENIKEAKTDQYLKSWIVDYSEDGLGIITDQKPKSASFIFHCEGKIDDIELELVWCRSLNEKDFRCGLQRKSPDENICQIIRQQALNLGIFIE